MKSKLLEYFESHPEARNQVMKAYYAYHADVTQDHSHKFEKTVESRCAECGRTREEVRWDELPPTCLKWKEPESVSSIIHNEEKKYWKLVSRMEPFVGKFFKDKAVTGEHLAYLHQTHGFPAEDVCEIMGVKFESVRADYEASEASHADIGKQSFTPEIVITNL